MDVLAYSTDAVMFAFAGNSIFAGVYYSLQRLCKKIVVRRINANSFWGWQLIIVATALSLSMGYTQGKEYAEMEWPIDIAITVIWVVFVLTFLVL